MWKALSTYFKGAFLTILLIWSFVAMLWLFVLFEPSSWLLGFAQANVFSASASIATPRSAPHSVALSFFLSLLPITLCSCLHFSLCAPVACWFRRRGPISCCCVVVQMAGQFKIESFPGVIIIQAPIEMTPSAFLCFLMFCCVVLVCSLLLVLNIVRLREHPSFSCRCVQLFGARSFLVGLFVCLRRGEASRNAPFPWLLCRCWFAFVDNLY